MQFVVGAIKKVLFQDTDGCASGFTKCLLGRLPALCLSLFLGGAICQKTVVDSMFLPDLP